MPEARPVQHRFRLLLTSFSLTMLLVLTGTLGVAFLQARTASPAAAAPKPDPFASAKHAAGYTIKGQWFGSWRTADGRGFCIEFDKGAADNRGAIKLDGNVPQMSKEESARVRYITNKYGPTTSRLDGAAASIYVWQVQNTKRFDSYYARMVKSKAISKQIQARVAAMAAEAKNYGPFRLTMSQKAGYVGQTVAGMVTVRAHNGKAVRGMTVRLSVNGNGALARPSGTSTTQGTIGYTVKVTRPGAVQVNASLVTPTSAILLTRPSAGRQRLVLATKARSTATARVSSLRSIGAPTVRSTCDADCDGAAPVTVTMANPCGSAVLREHILSNGRQVGVVDIAPCKTATTSITLPDNALVTTSHCYLNGEKKCVAAPTANAGSLRVICPAMVQFRFSGACPCADSKTITYSVLAPASSTRTYTVTQTRTGTSGPKETTTTLTNGTWTPLPATTLARGDTLNLTVTVQGTVRTLDTISQIS